MATTFCPTLSIDPAVIFASGGYDTFMSLAPNTFNQALELAEQIGQIAIEPISFNADFNFDGQLSPFVRPLRPTIDPSRFDFNAPPPAPDAPAFQREAIQIDQAPDYNVPDPILRTITPPVTPVVAEPVPPPDTAPLVVPDTPDYVLPALPTLLDLNLPSVPAIVLPEFEGERPVFVEPSFAENWSFTPQQYVSELLDKVRGKVSGMMDGSTGLEPIEDALFGRGADRIALEVRRDIDTRVTEFASRGFSEPNGILASAVDQIIQSGQNRKAELNREITIQSYQELLTNLRFAVQQGIALEQVAVNLHIQMQQMALSAAQFARETALAILNARISVFNARLAAYQTDAAVLRDRIQAALARVELYRAQIEGEKARGEINQQRVELYTAQVNTLNVMADFYRAQVEGVKAQADVERSKIDKFKAMVDAFSARWSAYGEQVKAYTAQIEAENGAVQVHRNLVEAYAARVNATNQVNRGRIDVQDLRLREHQQALLAWRGGLDRMLALFEGERARVAAEGQRADAIARIYTADAGVETAASAASDRSLQIGLERARAQNESALESARIRVQENVQLTGFGLEAIKAQAQVLAQLAAAALSSMNFSASVSSSRSESKACSTGISWNGEAPDYTG